MVLTGQLSNPPELLARLAGTLESSQLSLIRERSADPEEDARQALRELEGPARRLLILDNVPDEAAVQEWLDAPMLAPPGPVSAEALRFTLVKPLVGPCTMICASSVSPRAPDKPIERDAPALSVFPTLVRLDATHTLNGGGGACANT